MPKPAAANNYRYSVSGGAWRLVTGTATFNGEADRRVVVLRFNSNTAFEPGDTVEVGVGSSVTDPFGQTVSSRTLTGRVDSADLAGKTGGRRDNLCGHPFWL